MADGGLRRRGGARPETSFEPVDDDVVERAARVVRRLDVYSNNKLSPEFKVQTEMGGRISVAGWVVTLVLFLGELRAYLTVGNVEHMVVDTTLGHKLRIDMNVTFPAINCAEVHLDAMDVAGDYHPYMEQHMHKQRLDVNGRPKADKVKEEANVVETSAKEAPALDPDYCGSCYGADTAEQPCCNTCESVVTAYNGKGWSVADVERTAEQCVREKHDPLSAVQKGEGCNLAGWLEVNKVAGNFHVALGESAVRDGRFIHQFHPADAPGFNVSHTIHHLSFGAQYPGMLHPLNGVVKLCDEEEGTGLFQYFIKLVPTVFKDVEPLTEAEISAGGRGKTSAKIDAKAIDAAGEETDVVQGPPTAAGDAPLMLTNRFSYTERFRPLAVNEEKRQKHDLFHDGKEDHLQHAKKHHETTLLPGIFWVYELSAFMVEVSHTHVPFSHFLVRCCAIIGGVYSTSGFLDRALSTVSLGSLGFGGAGGGKAFAMN